ncbi:receptor-type tyrosine-protein phosphatase alpha-like, partial [Actinia tenebrosa]|uniref:Receptor-type tyrosine-protein phosphatase alpha-like n=1 Tax=Actinia tenebrosa TaxID=6105 RepID=A0A6P8H9X3_ACTTE
MPQKSKLKYLNCFCDDICKAALILTRRIVFHLQHLNWENKCIPADPQTVLNLIDEVQKYQQKSGNSPIVVQCSNGDGRSGTFCAIASCLERVKQEQVLDVFQTVKSIRVNRPGAVETL